MAGLARKKCRGYPLVIYLFDGIILIASRIYFHKKSISKENVNSSVKSLLIYYIYYNMYLQIINYIYSMHIANSFGFQLLLICSQLITVSTFL